METTTNNTKPLYKILDEQRSAGIWKAEESSNEVDYMIMAEDSQMPIIISTEDGVAPQYQNKERAKANIEYAVLASNNLASIAEALENLLDYVGPMDDTSMSGWLLKQQQEAINLAREALRKIS